MSAFIARDERETAIDHAADRLSYLVLAFGTLLAAAWRSFSGEAAWDLLGLVVLAGAAGLVFRLGKGAITRAWSGPPSSQRSSPSAVSAAEPDQLPR